MKFVKTTVVLASIVSLTMLMGCSEPAAVKEMNDFADSICKCEDMKCARETTQEMREMTKKYAAAKFSSRDSHKIKEAVKKATKKAGTCIAELHDKVAKKKE